MVGSWRRLALADLIGVVVAILAIVQPVHSAGSAVHESNAVTGRLITAQNGIPEDGRTLSAALHLNLKDGWKTYWRSPGEVGLPPSIDWSGSLNVADVEFQWPAPERFRAFGIENYGYREEVAFPLRITLERPGEPVALRANVSLLVCSTVCVPETFDLALTLGPGDTIDPDASGTIARWASRVPGPGDTSGWSIEAAALEADASGLVVSIRANAPFDEPDLFVEWGDARFGVPDIRLSPDRRALWTRLPVRDLDEFGAPVLTIVDGERAATLGINVSSAVPAPPHEGVGNAPTLGSRLWMVAIAFLGGLVLNAMPCVLPVLSLKLSSAATMAGRSQRTIRIGFLAAAAGVMAFVWTLAAVLLGLRALGVSVGWGLQFQSPLFVAAALLLVVLFAASMMGVFEVRLPSRLATRLANAGGASGHVGDFATGAFGALLATPCSAPFLGTAVAFALVAGVGDVAAIFTALGLGLSLPYLAIAMRPSALRWLPSPGPWMTRLRFALGFLLLLTGLWLAWLLLGLVGPVATATALAFALVALMALKAGPRWTRFATIPILLVAVSVPSLFGAVWAEEDEPMRPTAADATWTAFNAKRIPQLISRGKVVFVDVTADWCLTCKANKAIALDRPTVIAALGRNDVVAMRADWTRPDPEILAYLRRHGRVGIPFNVVYGPATPEGVVLSELLSAKAVIDAVDAARGVNVSQGDPTAARPYPSLAQEQLR